MRIKWNQVNFRIKSLENDDDLEAMDKIPNLNLDKPLVKIESEEKPEKESNEINVASGMSRIKEIKLNTLIEVETPPTSTPRGDNDNKGSTKGSMRSNQSLISESKDVNFTQ